MKVCFQSQLISFAIFEFIHFVRSADIQTFLGEWQPYECHRCLRNSSYQLYDTLSYRFI